MRIRSGIVLLTISLLAASGGLAETVPAASGSVLRFEPLQQQDDVLTMRYDADLLRDRARAGTRLRVERFPLRGDLRVDLDLEPLTQSASQTRFVIGNRHGPDRVFEP